MAVVKIYGCDAPTCNYVTESEPPMRAHCRAVHDNPDAYHPQQDAQTLFRRAGQRWFKVQVPTEDDHQREPATVQGQHILDTLHRRYDAYQTYRRQAASEMPNQLEDTSLSLWDRRTGWPINFAGLDMAALHALTKLPEDRRDPASWRIVLLPAVVDVFIHCQTGVRQKSIIIRRLFYTVDTDLTVIHPEPLTPVQAQSLEKYVLVWQHLICFLLRATRPGQMVPHLQLQPRIRQRCEDLRRALAGPTHAVEPKAVQRIIFQVSVALLKEEYATDPWRGPLLYFLAVWAHEPETKTWPLAYAHAQVLLGVWMYPSGQAVFNALVSDDNDGRVIARLCEAMRAFHKFRQLGQCPRQ